MFWWDWFKNIRSKNYGYSLETGCTWQHDCHFPVPANLVSLPPHSLSPFTLPLFSSNQSFVTANVLLLPISVSFLRVFSSLFCTDASVFNYKCANKLFFCSIISVFAWAYKQLKKSLLHFQISPLSSILRKQSCSSVESKIKSLFQFFPLNFLC